MQSRPSSPIAIIQDLVRMQALTPVQQPCSNPSKSPEMLGNSSTQKYLYLQAFCNLQKPPANYHAAFTRRRAWVRTQHRPLRKRGLSERATDEHCRYQRMLSHCAPSQGTSVSLPSICFHDLPAWIIVMLSKMLWWSPPSVSGHENLLAIHRGFIGNSSGIHWLLFLCLLDAASNKAHNLR